MAPKMSYSTHETSGRRFSCRYCNIAIFTTRLTLDHFSPPCITIRSLNPSNQIVCTAL